MAQILALRKPKDATSTYILKIVGVGLLFTAASILAPQLPYLMLRALIKKKFGRNYSREQISGSVRYLKRKKFIALENKQGGFKAIVTKLGHKRMQKLSLSEISIKKEKWDGQWRLLTFDIPESQLPARRIFARKLKELGFFHFQKSVFILPYDCEKEVNAITQILDITSHVHILTAQRFISDSSLIKKFKLRQG